MMVLYLDKAVDYDSFMTLDKKNHNRPLIKNAAKNMHHLPQKRDQAAFPTTVLPVSELWPSLMTTSSIYLQI
jgi:hypothetical protein